MHFLSIESSTKNFALAVSEGAKVLRHKTFVHTKLLEDVILKNIDVLLGSAKIPFNKIDAFVVSLGPGSFTSLRVGLATIKAFCLATGKPMAGICSLDTIAHGQPEGKYDEICVIVDARRSMVYSAIYQRSSHGLRISRPYALSPLTEVLDFVHGTTLFTGDAVALYQKDIKKAYADHGGKCRPVFAGKEAWQPKPEVLARLGFERLHKKDYDDPAAVTPIYLYEDSCQVHGGKKSKGN